MYKQTRNGMLGPDYSTKFSPWLASGSLSPRLIYEEVKQLYYFNHWIALLHKLGLWKILIVGLTSICLIKVKRYEKERHSNDSTYWYVILSCFVFLCSIVVSGYTLNFFVCTSFTIYVTDKMLDWMVIFTHFFAYFLPNIFLKKLCRYVTVKKVNIVLHLKKIMAIWASLKQQNLPKSTKFKTNSFFFQAFWEFDRKPGRGLELGLSWRIKMRMEKR